MTKAEKWARTVKDQMKQMSKNGWNQAWVGQKSNLGFMAYVPPASKTRGQPAAITDENLVGVYTMDVPLEHLEEDIQAFIDANFHKRSRFGMLA